METSNHGDAELRQLETSRVVAFTDGVFAIIITILVLDIKVPELGSGQSLRDALSDAEPTLVSWVISFLIVGMYWSWHRGGFGRVRFADLSLVWLNLLFLLPVSLIPFAASALGEYSDDPIALRLYGGVLIAASLARLAIIWYLVRHPHMLWESLDARVARLDVLAGTLPLLVYVAAIALADAAPSISRILYLLVPALYLGLIALLRTDRRTRSAAEELT